MDLTKLDPTDPTEALELVDVLLGQLQGTRADHAAIQTAIATLRAAMTPNT